MPEPSTLVLVALVALAPVVLSYRRRLARLFIDSNEAMYALFAKAQRCEKAGKLREALALYQQAAAKWPHGLEAHYIQHQIVRLEEKAAAAPASEPAEARQTGRANRDPRPARAGRWAARITAGLSVIPIVIWFYSSFSGQSDPHLSASAAAAPAPGASTIASRALKQPDAVRRVALPPPHIEKDKKQYKLTQSDVVEAALMILGSGDKKDSKAAPDAATSDRISNVPASLPIDEKPQAPVPRSVDKTEWTTLRKEISGDYANAPGGLEEAVELARRHLQDQGRDRHFGTWKVEVLDEKIYASTPKVWPPPSLARSKVATPSGHLDAVTYGVAVPLARGRWMIYLNSKAPDFSAAKKHELTHATIGRLSTDDLIRPAKQVNLWRNWTGDVSFRIEKSFWSYAGTYAELDPRIASVKREYARGTGRQVDTKKQAEWAIQWVREKHKPTSTAPRSSEDVDIIDVQERDLREAIKQRMLELVMGNGKSWGGQS
jgi:hypothetical protein